MMELQWILQTLRKKRTKVIGKKEIIDKEREKGSDRRIPRSVLQSYNEQKRLWF